MGFNPNLMDFERPYVHSSAVTLQKASYGTFISPKSKEGQERAKKLIEELQSIKKVLQIEANAFLDGKSPTEVFSQRANKKDLWKYARDSLRSPKATALMAKHYLNKTDLEKYPQFKKIVSEMTENTISESEFFDKIASKLLASFEKLGEKNTLKEQLRIIRREFKIKKQDSAARELEEVIKGKLTSSKGKIKEAIAIGLKKNGIEGKNGIKELQDYFRKDMWERLEKDQKFFNKEEVENYIDAVNKKLAQVNFAKAIPNIIGQKGEEIFQILYESEPIEQTNKSFGVKLTLTNSFDEDKIMEEYSDLVVGKMKTHHQEKKMSQTDFLFTNPEGKTVRVQSKNIETAYNAFLSGKPFPGYAKLQETVEYKKLINQMRDTNTLHLSDEECAILSYLIANEAWLRIKKDSTDQLEKFKQRGKSVDASSARKRIADNINKTLLAEITNFIGINIDQNIDVATIKKASKSNVFYLVSNAVLIPTYSVIGNLIKILQGGDHNKNSLFVNFAVSLDTSGISVSSSANQLYEQKMAALEEEKQEFDKDTKRYNSSSLLAVGKGVGKSIIDQVKIKGIGLKFDFEKLKKTSWMF